MSANQWVKKVNRDLRKRGSGEKLSKRIRSLESKVARITKALKNLLEKD